jgi:hypothetical protein
MKRSAPRGQRAGGGAGCALRRVEGSEGFADDGRAVETSRFLARLL